MEQDEFKIHVKKHDRRIGIYPPTIRFKDKRNERLESVPAKVLYMAKILIDRNIDFQVLEALCSSHGRNKSMLTDIYIPKYNIAMRYVDMDNKKSIYKSYSYFNSMKRKSYPFFIRSNESDEFLLGKLENCIDCSSKCPKDGLGDKFVLLKQRRKRIEKSKIK